VVESAQTLDRGLRVLFALADAPRGRTVAELSAELGLARPILYRLLAALEAHGLARRGGDGTFRIGLAVLDLARRVQPMIREAALPVLRGLAERVGATAHLTVADSGEALAVAVVEPSWTAYHVGYRVGSRHPLDRGAAGRAILLARAQTTRARPTSGPEPAQETIGHPGAPEPAHPPETANPPEATQWLATEGELQAGAQGVAAPVLDVPGLEASVGVVALGDLVAEEVGPHVVAAAARISTALR
jgi:DNA-binding IclR family transcriptional regulator